MSAAVQETQGGKRECPVMDQPGASNSPLRDPPSDYCPAGSARWFVIPSGPDAGRKLFYYDFGGQESRQQETVLFCHGNPESSYTFRKIRDGLMRATRPIRLVAVDHMGFGLSDQATHETIDMHHAQNLACFLKALNLTDLTLVVHDWGGPIGIGAALQEPWRVRRLVVLNTSVFPIPDEGYTYTRYPFRISPWASMPWLIPDGLWGGLAAFAVCHAEKQSFPRFISRLIPFLIRHATRGFETGSPDYVFSQMFRSTANVRSSKRNVLHSAFLGHGYEYRDPVLGHRSNREFYRHIQSTIASAWKDIEVLGFFGTWDPLGKPSVIQQWHEALPQMKKATCIYPDAGHFIEETKGEAIAEKLLAVLNCALAVEGPQ